MKIKTYGIIPKYNKWSLTFETKRLQSYIQELTMKSQYDSQINTNYI